MAVLYATGSGYARGPLVTQYAGGILYRRTDDYYCAYFLRIGFGPSSVAGGTDSEATVTYTDTTDTTDAGTIGIKTIATIATLFDQNGNSNFTHLWGDTGVAFEQNDARITYSLANPVTSEVSPVSLLPDVPTRRCEYNQLFIQTTFPPANGQPGFNGASYIPNVPIPITPNFSFDGTIYTCQMGVTFRNTGGGPASEGRLLAFTSSYTPGGYGANCGFDGAYFNTFDDEKAHSTMKFKLQGGEESRAFNYMPSVVSFPATQTRGVLNFNSNSEVGGPLAARAFFPAIVRATATFVTEGRVSVDISSTLSPTADVLGTYIEDGGRYLVGPGAMNYIDHFETGGVSYAPQVAGGVYIPSTVFDIVFKDSSTSQMGALTLNAVVDANGLPPDNTDASDAYPGLSDGAPTTLRFNAYMSIPALLQVSANIVSSAQMIVRPSGEIKSRAKSQLWQHRGESRIWAGEVPGGAIFASDNEGKTWINMATNAWTGVAVDRVLGFTSLPFKGAISIAKVGSNVQSRYSPDGINWQTPVTVCPYAAGSWSIASHEHAGSDETSVCNLTTGTRFDSLNRGKTWQEVTD